MDDWNGISYNGMDWMIAWRGDHMEVGPWPDRTGWSRKYDLTTGCCNFALHEQSESEIAASLVGQALYLISDGVPKETVFREFAKIRIWREMRIKLTTGGEPWAFYPPVGYLKLNPYFD